MRKSSILKIAHMCCSGSNEPCASDVSTNGSGLSCRTVNHVGFGYEDFRCDIHGNIQLLVNTGLDITRQKEAEEEISRSLSLAESAWAESDAMRKATLALTQDLRMDNVLDTLLRSLRDLVPFDSANILLLEADSRLFIAREFPHRECAGDKYPLAV